MDAGEVEQLHDDIDLSAAPDKAERFEELGLALDPGEYGRASFLAAAADHWSYRERHDHALALLDAAGDGQPDELVTSISAHRALILLRAGRVDDANEIVGERRTAFRRGEVSVAECLMIGDSLEEFGDPVTAERWFTLPLAPFDPDDDPDLIDPYCLMGRYRVRRAQAKGFDAYDRFLESEDPEVAERLRETQTHR